VTASDPGAAGVPPLFVISLQRAMDRRAFAIDAWARVGLTPVIVDAVDGNRLTPDERALYSPFHAMYRFGRLLTPGEVAVALSHLKVCRIMLEAGYDEAAVFEDDVLPLPALVEVLEQHHRLPRDADVVTLHSLFEWATPTPVDGPPIVDGFHVCRYARTPMGAQAYVIRAHAARRLLEIGFPVRLPSDELMFRPDPARLTVYGVEPSPVVHGTFESELHAVGRTPDDTSLVRGGALEIARFAGRVHRRLQAATR
jgi:glycosyl transferase family 25